MSLYFIVLVVSLVGPLIFSLHPQIKFYKKWGSTFLSGIIVGLPFWIWDSIATLRGDWSFNNQYVWSTRIVNLPIEEVLFFIVIPFCCLFVWHLLSQKTDYKFIQINRQIKYFVLAILIILSIISRHKFYTSTVLLWTVLTIFIVTILQKKHFQSSKYWLWILITFVPFLIVNGILTYLPIVEYSPLAIIGWRFVSIPIEDFVYSWCLLTLNLTVYLTLNSPRIVRPVK